MEIIKIGKDLRSNRGLSALTTGLWAFGYFCASGPAGMAVSLAVSAAIYGGGYLYHNRPALFKKAVTQQQVEHAEQVNSYEPTTQKVIKRAFDDVVKMIDAKYHLQKPVLVSIYHAFTTSSIPTEDDIVIRSGVKEGALDGYSLSDGKPHRLAGNLAIRKVGSSYYEVQIGQSYIEFETKLYRSHYLFSGKSKEEVTEMLAKALILRAFASHINERHEHRSFIGNNSFAQCMLAFYIAPSFIHNLFLAIALPLVVISPLVAIIAINLAVYGIGYGISLYDSAVYRGHFYNSDEFVADNGYGEVLRDYYAASIDTSSTSYSDLKPSAHDRAENLHHYLHTQPPRPFILKR